jgi:secretion/DNA translocation related TadE-like protein
VRWRAGSPRPTDGGWAGKRPPPHDRGSATVWAVAGVAVIMTVFLVGLHLGSAVIARHRAEAAADLAALAAAGVAVEGAEAACDRAGEVAAAMGGTVTSCGLVGWDALVEVRVPTEVALPGIDGATGRARAGPVPWTSAADLDPAPPVAEDIPPNGPHLTNPISSHPRLSAD